MPEPLPPAQPLAVGPSPVTAILGARLITNQPPEPGEDQFTATSLPGHLLHYVLSGKVDQQCNGRRYHLKPGTVLWYHEDEEVRGRVLERPWDFISIHFIAPTLAPPPFEGRVWHHQGAALPLFQQLLLAFDSTEKNTRRVLNVHCALQALLLRYLPATGAGDGPGRGLPPAENLQLWWRLETELRRDLARPVDMTTLEQLGHASAATITRSCRQAVGQSPMKRLKAIRLSMARGLVLHSQLSMTEISGRVGYSRVHEFSRDYRRHYGIAPSHEARGYAGN